jgi:hypothetical protein
MGHGCQTLIFNRQGCEAALPERDVMNGSAGNSGANSGNAAEGMAPNSAVSSGIVGGATSQGSGGAAPALAPDGPGSAGAASSSPAGNGSSGADQAQLQPGHAVDYAVYERSNKKAAEYQARLEKLEADHRKAVEELEFARKVQRYVPQQQPEQPTPAQVNKAEDLFAKFQAGGDLTEREQELVALVKGQQQRLETLETGWKQQRIQTEAAKIRTEFASAQQKYPDVPAKLLQDRCLANPQLSVMEVAEELAAYFDQVHESRMARKAAPAAPAPGQQTSAPAPSAASKAPPVVGTGRSAPAASAQEPNAQRDPQGRWISRLWADAATNARARFGK